MQSPRPSAQPPATTPNGPSVRRHLACQRHVPTRPHKARPPANGSPNSSAKPDGSRVRPDGTAGPADLATAVNQPGALPPDHARSVPPRKPVTRFHDHSGSSGASGIAQRQYTLSLIVMRAELTLWGPGFRPDPFPARFGSAMLRVTSELGKEAGNVCLRRNRCASQALPAGGHRRQGARCSSTATCRTGWSRSCR
jgi:hypothetical protein